MKYIHNMLNNLFNIIFPEKCVNCGENKTLFCEQCLKNVPLANNNDSDIIGAGSYKNKALKKAIWILKYKKAKRMAKPLAKLIYENAIKKLSFYLGRFENNPPNENNWIIIPIPLSKKRLRERGFNQSELIAKHLAKLLDIPTKTVFVGNFVDKTNVLYKTKDTPTQVSIQNKKERLNNLQNAFTVKKPEQIKNKNIILLDDVSTTGATLREAKKLLEKFKPNKIITIVVAK